MTNLQIGEHVYIDHNYKEFLTTYKDHQHSLKYISSSNRFRIVRIDGLQCCTMAGIPTHLLVLESMDTKQRIHTYSVWCKSLNLYIEDD